ncbi:MAG: protein-export chaperone SecB [Pseudomonadota bacterium]
MANNETPETNDQGIEKEEDIGVVQRTPMVIHRQYLKDLSFENPNAPGIFQNMDDRPEMDMNIMLDVNKIEHEKHEHYYEVVLSLKASAVRAEDAMFLAQIDYAAAVSIERIKPAQHHPLLFIEVPKMLFPFARHILSFVTQNGAFTPLQVGPVDFRQMYLARFGDKNASEEQTEAESNEADDAEKQAAH